MTHSPLKSAEYVCGSICLTAVAAENDAILEELQRDQKQTDDRSIKDSSFTTWKLIRDHSSSMTDIRSDLGQKGQVLATSRESRHAKLSAGDLASGGRRCPHNHGRWIA